LLSGNERKVADCYRQKLTWSIHVKEWAVTMGFQDNHSWNHVSALCGHCWPVQAVYLFSS